MSDECLKLTTYFGERQRSARAFVADELLDLYGRHELATSILLRGAAGFGHKHHLRTDRLLTLSEDLPLVSVAVDSRARIECALEEQRSLDVRGLVTVERARMLTGAGAVAPPERLGEATKLTVYLGRQERVDGVAAFAAVCDLLHRRGVAGATVLLGVDGTARGVRTRARFFARNADVPLMVIAVGDGDAIGRVLPELRALLRDPLLTLERVCVCKRDGERLASPPAPGGDGTEVWQKLMVYTSEQTRHEGRPVHDEIVRRLRRSGAAGATTLRGIWGFHGDHPPHGDRLLQIARRVPVVTTVVDTPARIADAFEVVDELTAERGLVTSEAVPAVSTRG